MKKLLIVLAAMTALPALAACGGDDDYSSDGGSTTAPAATGPVVFSSTAFDSGQPIPVEYSCDGDNVSPPLTWSNVPADAESLAIEMVDPDAGDYVHWLLFDLPPDVSGLESGVPTDAELDSGAKQANNSKGDVGYTGPCPPSGEHSYVFRIYAINAMLGLDPGGDAADVQDALADHTLALSELVGTFQR